MKKKYTKKQIQESIRYWQKQLKLGNYKKLNESGEKFGLTPKQCTLVNDFFVDVNTSNGEIPATETLEAVKFKDDPGYADGGEQNYNDLLAAYGPPSLAWLASDYAWYAMDGRNIDTLTDAFNKLAKAGLISCNAKTGVVSYDVNRLSIVEDKYGWEHLAIDGELI